MRFHASIAAGLAGLAVLAAPASAAKHVVIAAGSSGFYNYRHQADACHAYQVALKSGVAPENIILMMADDVASDPSNPIKGKLINKPNGPDVYAGCKVDYRGEVVTKQLFIDVVTGNSSATTKKVLKSTAEDEVFLYFVDHGGVGLIAFPYGAVMTQTEMKTTLATMASKKMYKEMVFYMEACESGSMFDGKTLPSDVKVLAVTAANDHESSWGFYCPPNDKVNGTEIGSCLGDLFSISWMEDSDSHDLSSTTFASQIERVTARTNKSHVQQFGDKGLEKETIGTFQLSQYFMKKSEHQLQHAHEHGNAMDAVEIEMKTAVWKVRRATTKDAKAVAQAELEEVSLRHRARDAIFADVLRNACHNDVPCATRVMNRARSGTKFSPCYEELVNVVHKECRDVGSPRQTGWDDYSMMEYSKMLASLCQASEAKEHAAVAIEELPAIVAKACQEELAPKDVVV